MRDDRRGHARARGRARDPAEQFKDEPTLGPHLDEPEIPEIVRHLDRFAATFDQVSPGLGSFYRDAMTVFADTQLT